MTIILDMGGVIMQHNIPACVAHFRELIGEEAMVRVLGLIGKGEGTENTLIERFETGDISTEDFLSTLLPYAKSGTTTEDLKLAWNLMHGGIPVERLEMICHWHKEGHRLFLLSNNNTLHWADVFSKYDLSMFEHCFASHLLHCCKPNPQIFEITDDYLHAHHLPAPYIFVDDIEANRKAAEQFGWTTFPDLETLDSFLHPHT